MPAPSAPADTGAPAFFALDTENEGDALKIALNDISPNPFNDRDLGDVTQLAESIEQDDLLQDITVMHTSAFAEHYPKEAEGITTKYVIAFGERRWRAHLHLGRETIAAILRNSVAPKIRRVLFAENFHRKQLSAIEEARKFRLLHVEEGMSYREIVAELKLSGPNYVARRMELLDLAPRLQDIVGTENGPGVTLARSIKARLDHPDDQVRAWELIRNDELTLNQAVERILAGEAVPQGNTPGDEEYQGDETVPQGNTPTDTPSGGTPPVPPGNTPEARAKRPATSKAPAAADRHAAERNNASADREQACQQIITAGTELTPDQHDALFARTLLAPMQQGAARTRAHRWLREAGRAQFDISDTDSYFEAVLSSGQTELVNRVAVATALAAGEVRARDGRRQWDKTDAEHVRLLIETSGYVPETAWERAQLDKFGIQHPGVDSDPDPETIH